MKLTTLFNQPFLTVPTFVGLDPDELRYFPFFVSLHRCDEIWNILDYPSTLILDLSDRLCGPIKTELYV